MRLVIAASTVLLAFSAASAAEKDFTRPDVINSDSDCANPKGNEVNARVQITAPSGTFFEKDTTKVYAEADMRSFTDKAHPSGCFLENEKTQYLPVTTKSGRVIKYPVMTGFEVYGHSDCGSGEGTTATHIAHGERIRTHCSVKAKLYTQDDLK